MWCKLNRRDSWALSRRLGCSELTDLRDSEGGLLVPESGQLPLNNEVCICDWTHRETSYREGSTHWSAGVCVRFGLGSWGHVQLCSQLFECFTDWVHAWAWRISRTNFFPTALGHPSPYSLHVLLDVHKTTSSHCSSLRKRPLRYAQPWSPGKLLRIYENTSVTMRNRCYMQLGGVQCCTGGRWDHLKACIPVLEVEPRDLDTLWIP